MRTGFALTMHRSAAFQHRTARGIACRAAREPIISLVAAIFLAAVLAAQAQESIEPDILPSLAEPSAAPAKSLPSTSTEPLPALPQSLSSAPAEPSPSSAEPLPSSAEAFPSSPEPLSSSFNYTVAQTTVVPAPVPAGPYGGLMGNKNVFPGGETAYSGEPRRFHYAFGLTVRGVWDDNVFLSHTDRVSDYYFAIEPWLTFGWGDIQGRNQAYFRLDYMPSIILYTDHSDEDAVNHLIHLEAGYHFSRLTLTAIQDIAILDSANLNSFIDTTGLHANLDASGIHRWNIFNTRLRADYELTAKVSLQADLDVPIFDYPDGFSDGTVSGGLYIYYKWLPKVSVGIGGTFGYNWVEDPSTNQTFEQVNLRFSYDATAKLNIYASAGVEFRQFDGNRDDYVSPVFEVGATYNPFVNTTFTLAAGRRIYNSGYLANQDFGGTYVVGRFQQRLFHRVYLGLTAGYENDHYISTDNDVSATRDDNYWFIEPSLDVLITRWLSAGAYYLHRQDSSSDDFNSFYDNQVGVRATVRF
jgi:hypothetical protein